MFCGLQEIFERLFGNLNMDRVDIAEAKFFIFMIKGADLSYEGSEASFLQGDFGHIVDQVGEVPNFFTVAFFDHLKKRVDGVYENFLWSPFGVLCDLLSCETQVAENGIELVCVYVGGRKECTELDEGLLKVEIGSAVYFLLFHGNLVCNENMITCLEECFD